MHDFTVNVLRADGTRMDQIRTVSDRPFNEAEWLAGYRRTNHKIIGDLATGAKLDA